MQTTLSPNRKPFTPPRVQHSKKPNIFIFSKPFEQERLASPEFIEERARCFCYNYSRNKNRSVARRTGGRRWSDRKGLRESKDIWFFNYKIADCIYICYFFIQFFEWSQFMHRKESLGRMAVFLLPSLKLKIRDPADQTLEDKIHQFLLANFNGYTVTSGNIFGFWRDSVEKESYGEHKEYKVSFAGREKVVLLEKFLSNVALAIGEKCIYLETGEDAWLIYPIEKCKVQ